jgi:hypothetical protein
MALVGEVAALTGGYDSDEKLLRLNQRCRGGASMYLSRIKWRKKKSH